MNPAGPSGDVWQVAFSPDGARLYAVTEVGVYVYALKIADLVALARSRVTRSLTSAECQEYLHAPTCGQ